MDTLIQKTGDACRAKGRRNGMAVVGAKAVCWALLLTLLLSSTATAAGRTLKYGQSGDDVRVMQTRLIELGYYTGAASGEFDVDTRTAVKLFQKANNMSADGSLNASEQRILYSAGCLSFAQYNEALPLVKGDSGAAVVTLQKQLAQYGYFTASVSGQYDAATYNAVKAFQTANGIKASGKATRETRLMLNAGKGITASEYDKVRPLKYGNKSSAVVVLQRRLTELEYYDGALDGKYDAEVKSAVKFFQSANGLKATGTADVNTRTKMNGDSCISGATYNLRCALKTGNSGVAVKVLQSQLTRLGFYAEEIDGKYDSGVKSAVKLFQTANGVKASGTADVNTRARMLSENCVDATAYDKVRPLKSGTSGSAVMLLQNQLSKLGYYVGQVNGKYDSATKNAVKVFQKANALKVSGTADVNTRTRLNSGNGVTREEYDANRSLKKGELGSTVRAMQNRLIALGYYSGAADGYYQSSTQKAVKLFQTAHGLNANGVADVKTRRLMFSASAVHYVDYEKVRPIKYGEKGETVYALQNQLYRLGYLTEMPDARYNSTTKKAVLLFQKVHGLDQNGSYVSMEMREMLNADDCISLDTYYRSVALKSGDSGEAVKYLQRRLTELGYFTEKITGSYGNSTAKAVASFQTANALNATGTADVNTRAVMNSSAAITKSQYENSRDDAGSADRQEKIERLIAAARSKLGCKYVHNTSGPDTFDCSGFTKYAFGTVGIELSGAAYNQGYMDKLGKPYRKKITSYNELQRGDLLIFDTNKSDSDLSDHVGIYLGDGTFIHASSAKAEVVISNLARYGNFSWAFRLI